ECRRAGCLRARRAKALRQARAGTPQAGRARLRAKAPLRPRRTSSCIHAKPILMRNPGDILLVSCYELGHQPLSLASPLGTLSRAGFTPIAVDTSVETLDDAAITAAQLVAISVYMHTALRLGGLVAARVRALNRAAHVCFYGLYATLNAEYLLREPADSVIGGEYEGTLLDLARALEAGGKVCVPGVRTREVDASPVLARLPFAPPERTTLPALGRYAHLVWGDLRVP